MHANKRLLIGLAAVLFVPLLGVKASAQVGLSKISGYVFDDDNKPINGATVEFDRVDIRSGPVKLKTNKTGYYVDATLQVGDYDLVVYGPDGKTVIYKQSAIHLNFDELRIDVHQNIGTKAQAAAAANKSAAAQSGTMSQEDIDAILSGQRKAADEAEKVNFINSLLKENKDLRDQGKFDEAIPKMEQAVQVDPTRDILWGNLGDDYMSAKQWDKAVDAFQKELALQTVPAKQANTTVALGNALMQKGDMVGANEQYAKAKALDPEVGKMAAYNAALGLFNAGKIDESITAFNDVIAADPGNANAYFYKGLALLNKATMDPKTQKMIPAPGTLEALQKAIDLAPNSANAAQAKQILASIK